MELTTVKVVCFCALFGLVVPSAIPMWEFLSKQEKMSFLYSMFANQVEEFCEDVKMENCNHELLKYGLNKLKDMPEDHMDTMDPYQRGANNIIWESMMEGHEMLKNPHKAHKATSTAKPNSYEDQSFGSDYEVDNQPEGSAKIESVYRVPPPKGFVFKIESGKPLYTYGYNNQYISNSPNKPYQQKAEYVPEYITKKASQQNVKYHQTNQHFQPTYTTSERRYDIVEPSSESLREPFEGPMVYKVYPDGSPVHEQKPLPQDDDLRQYQLTKVKIPNL